MLWGTYLTTAAPDLTFWDAPEFIAAARTLGIPHPPGTPLWVLLGHIGGQWFDALSPPRAVTMVALSVAALTGGLGASMAARWIGGRGAVVAAVAAGTMYTVWSNATEAEVYAFALFASVAMLAAGEWAGRADASDLQRARGRALVAFIAGLAVPLHLSVLVALPAAVAFAWRGAWPRAREVATWVALVALGLSAVAILPLLSAQDPAIDSGHPVTLRALIAVLRREQYVVAGLWPRMAPLWLQVGNVFQWADWQVAYGAHPFPTPALVRTPLSVAFGVLGVLGLRALGRHDARVSRAMLVLVVSALVGVAVWLNLRAGPSYGYGVLPDGAPHEARERDYFFALGFWAWGLLAGVGAAAIARDLAARVRLPALRVLAMAPLAVALVPLFANRAVADRTREPVATLPRTYARLLLDAVPMRGVLLAGGDNDTFPLWYLQQVEDYRPDVTVVTVPLLGAGWYRAWLIEQGLLPARVATAWPGRQAVLQSIVMHATRARREVRASALLPRAHRVESAPTEAWRLEGLVYAPEPGAPGSTRLDAVRQAQAAAQVPLGALAPLPPGADPAADVAQQLLRCASITNRADPLLVSGCGGF
ncbi:MAG: DUF2723 domain-containing protein [Gemmatimonadetes bacterium]|nr:DUF2723 domain-containing protein [Gemmatimonadota bacterium]